MYNTGKIVVITGATSGIGLATIKEIAARGAYVVGTGRSEEKCKKAENEVRSSCPGAKVHYIVSDLSSIRGVERLAEMVKEKLAQDNLDHIDALINNAGTFSSWYVTTADGFELQFAVNHLAPFQLTYRLIPLLMKSTAGTVVTVSSGSHYRTRIRWNDIMMRVHYNGLMSYKQSKLANVIFATELERRLNKCKSCMKSFALDPGLVNTDIGLKGTSGIAKKIWEIRKNKGTPAEKPAKAVAFLVFEPSIRGMDEVYWKDCLPVKPSRYSQLEEVGCRLWKLSERMCGIKFEFEQLSV